MNNPGKVATMLISKYSQDFEESDEIAREFEKEKKRVQKEGQRVEDWWNNFYKSNKIEKK